ncbi:hypothetical protein KAR91_25580 [Candidatus Pacearchaeota archaeon]|nr:hypothetical protein [Candidatus Pacearchaeota archaeon]
MESEVERFSKAIIKAMNPVSFELSKENNRIVFEVQRGKEKVKLSLSKTDAKTVANEIFRLINTD